MSLQRCLVALAFLVATAGSSRADIYRWDNGWLIPGTEGITPGPAVQLLIAGMLQAPPAMAIDGYCLSLDRRRRRASLSR